MTTGYLLLKFVHILTAILALGASAGLGILLEFYGNHPTHGSYILRCIVRMEWFFVLPGYLLMPVTGMWMATGVWPVTTPWVAAALAVWATGLGFLLGTLAVLNRQIQVLESAGPMSSAYRRLSLLGRALGAAAGLSVVAILFLMVAKPALTWFAN